MTPDFYRVELGGSIKRCREILSVFDWSDISRLWNPMLYML